MQVQSKSGMLRETGQAGVAALPVYALLDTTKQKLRFPNQPLSHHLDFYRNALHSYDFNNVNWFGLLIVSSRKRYAEWRRVARLELRVLFYSQLAIKPGSRVLTSFQLD